MTPKTVTTELHKNIGLRACFVAPKAPAYFDLHTIIAVREFLNVPKYLVVGDTDSHRVGVYADPRDIIVGTDEQLLAELLNYLAVCCESLKLSELISWEKCFRHVGMVSQADVVQKARIAKFGDGTYRVIGSGYRKQL